MFNWIIGIPLLTLFAAASLVLAVIPMTRREPSRPTLSALLILVTAIPFLSFMLHSVSFPSSLFWLNLIFICSSYASAVGVHFASQFTGVNRNQAKWLVRIIYVLNSLFVILIFTGKVASEATLQSDGAIIINFGPLAPLMWGLLTIELLVAIGFLFLALVKPGQTERKRHTIFPLIGFVVMVTGGLSNLFLSRYPVDVAATFIFVALVNYGVVSRNALRSAQKQSWRLSLPVASFTFALCYAAMFIFLFEWIEATAITSNLVASLIVIPFTLLAFSPSRKFISKKLRQSLFPTIYRYQEALSDLSSIDRSLAQWTNSVSDILNIIAKATRADSAILLLRDSNTKTIEAKYAFGRDSTNMLHLRWVVDSSLVKALAKSDNALSNDEIRQQTNFKVLLRGKDDTLQEIGPSLFCGVHGHDGILAIVVLVRKSWDRPEDKDFLKLACGQIAPLIINENLYQESLLEIEKQKRMQEALRKSEKTIRESAEKLRLIFESMADGVSITDLDNKIVEVNEAKLRMHGYGSKDELIGRSIFELVAEKDRAGANQHRKSLKEGFENNIIEAEVTFLTKDGREFPAEVSLTVFKDISDNPIGFITISRDISSRKAIEAEKRDLERKAHVASRLASIGEMASGIAHEINNPLTGVIGFSQLIMKQAIPDDIKEQIEIIHNGAQRVAGITNRLLTFARQHKPERTNVDINEIIQNTLALRAYSLQTNSIKVTIELAPDLPLTIADAGQLQQVFLNIVINAETEMRLARGRGELLVKTEKTDDTIRISFIDDGPGITRENMEKIFHPFFTTREVGQGTGLGLSLCHGIVTEHKGKIWAESEFGKGATFIVELPVVSGEEKVKLVATGDKPKGASQARILVVDDEPIILEFLKRVLGNEGHEVEVMNDAKGALERIKNNKYDIILLDIKLPEMSGIELYEHIIGINPALANRVAFVTGDVMSPDTKTFLSKAKTPFVTKPFLFEELIEVVNRVLADGV